MYVFLHKCQSCVFIVHKCMYFSLYPIFILKKLIKLLFHFIFNNFDLGPSVFHSDLGPGYNCCQPPSRTL